MSYFIGVDVGSGSARAGVFNESGVMLATSSYKINIYKPEENFVEQSSENIWQSVCASVKDAISIANIDINKISGIGFDATCSLVVLDKNGNPLTVSSTSDHNQNIIMWMDHRAKKEADQINCTQHEILKYVGRVISPEMQMPKLLWLKNNRPDTWRKIGYLFDLPDFLTWKATGDDTRSLCSTVCKWNYNSTYSGLGWDEDYLKLIGLDDLLEKDCKKIGQQIEKIGISIGDGLSQSAANDLGLKIGIPVSTSIIDAHAGGIGLLGIGDVQEDSFNKKIALISGTSSCHMAVSKDPRFINGIWGPYYDAMIPDYWLNEGGQSATGSLIDFIIQSHPSYPLLKNESDNTGKSIYQLLNESLSDLADGLENVSFLTKDINILPYFLGNQSPRANPYLKGVISGTSLSSSKESLAINYLAAIQAIAFGTKHIIEEMNNAGYEIDTIVCCGGDSKNSLFIQEHSNICNCIFLLPAESESVLLGSAMLVSVASGYYKNLPEAMRKMSKVGKRIEPIVSKHQQQFYKAKYHIFHEMYNDYIKYQKMMNF